MTSKNSLSKDFTEKFCDWDENGGAIELLERSSLLLMEKYDDSWRFLKNHSSSKDSNSSKVIDFSRFLKRSIARLIAHSHCWINSVDVKFPLETRYHWCHTRFNRQHLKSQFDPQIDSHFVQSSACCSFWNSDTKCTEISIRTARRVGTRRRRTQFVQSHDVPGVVWEQVRLNN